MSHIDVTNSIC